MNNSNLTIKPYLYKLYFTKSNKTINLLIAIFLVCLLTSCTKNSNVELKQQLLPHTRSEWRSLIEWPTECDEGVSHIIDDLPSFVGVESYKMSSGMELVEVVCRTGAYNQGEMYFYKDLDEKNSYRVLTFPQFASVSSAPSGLKWSTCNKTNLSGNNCLNKGRADINIEPILYQFNAPLLWGNIRIDTKKNIIVVDNFYRGGGGCGVSTSYSVAEEVPSILELKVHEECGQINLPVDSWLTIPPKQYQSWPTGDPLIW